MKLKVNLVTSTMVDFLGEEAQLKLNLLFHSNVITTVYNLFLYKLSSGIFGYIHKDTQKFMYLDYTHATEKRKPGALFFALFHTHYLKA